MENSFFSSVASLCDPGFTRILAFEFYDGPEFGLAVFSSGEALRFSVLGESQSRLFRAFDCALLTGNWREKILGVYCEPIDSGAPVIRAGEATDKALQLEREVRDAIAIKHYVAVGCSYLGMLSALEVSRDESEKIRNLGGDKAFATVHCKIKNYRKRLLSAEGQSRHSTTS